MPRPQSRMDLLYTKLTPPPMREKRVARLRLLQRLDALVKQKLTLVCAPAGYGKTTVLSQWIERYAKPVGWVSLDRSDNDLAQFLRYLLAAIQQVDPGAGLQILEMLQPSRPLPDPTIWIALINDLADSEKQFFIILDDYQEVEARPVHDALEYLIEHLPENVHLILSTRADPPLPLPRLRARGYLNEMRQNDLRFTTEEAADFLNDVMGLELSLKDVSALENRTEGWIAALQMAALSLQGHSPYPAPRLEFIEAFTGSHRYVLDYLVEEVLDQQQPELQDFLLKTSILEYLSGPLCDAILMEEQPVELDQKLRLENSQIPASASQATLEHLETANLFIIPMDDERRRYRYHRLFSDLLRKRLNQTSPGLVPVLHRRASTWHEQHGLMPAAIDHALAAQDFERAAVLIEQNAEATLMRSEAMSLLDWVEVLPDGWERSHPTLNFYYTWVLLMMGGPQEPVKQRLQELTSLEETAEIDLTMAGRLAALRAYLMIFKADLPRAAEFCHQAMKYLPESDVFLRNITTWILSLVRLSGGNIQDGKQTLEEVARLSQETGNRMIAVSALCDLAKLQKRQGQLQQAWETLEQALQLATDPLGRRLPIASKALIGLGELEREWNDLESAEAHLSESIAYARQWSEMACFDSHLALASVSQAQGKLEAARSDLQIAWEIARKSEFTKLDDLVVDLQQAHFYIIQGDLAAAMHWAENRRLLSDISLEQKPPTEEAQDYVSVHLRKYEHIVLAHLFIHQDRAAEALDLLAPLLEKAKQLGRIDLMISIQVLRAMAFDLEGQDAQALDSLAEALLLAEPGGYIRTFLDEGEAMARLLRRAASQGLATGYVTKLLDAFDVEISAERGATPETVTAQPLVDPLSERELEVLRLLASGLTNPEIADELIVAVSTVHSHCKSIYSKLNVHRRWDAVQRAQELDIL